MQRVNVGDVTKTAGMRCITVCIQRECEAFNHRVHIKKQWGNVELVCDRCMGERAPSMNRVVVERHSVEPGVRAVKASAKTGVTGSVADDLFITGYPHMENLEWRKAYAVVRRLPELRRQLMDLERRLRALEDSRGG